MSLDEKFQKAAEDLKNLKTRPNDDELLEAYALYKQGCEGDCNTSRPGVFDLKGKAKWDAWNGKKGMPQEDAKQAYISRVGTLIETYGLKE